jgi:hypothetical protein
MDQLSVSFLELPQALFETVGVQFRTAAVAGESPRVPFEISLKLPHLPLFGPMRPPIIGGHMTGDAPEPREEGLIRGVAPHAAVHLDHHLLRHFVDVLGRHAEEMKEREEIPVKTTDQLFKRIHVSGGGSERQDSKRSVIHPYPPSPVRGSL